MMSLTKTRKETQNPLISNGTNRKETTKNTPSGMWWYKRKSNYQKWMCVQDDFLRSQSKWSMAGPPKQGPCTQLLDGNVILRPAFHSRNGWPQHDDGKNGWRHTRTSACQVAGTCIQVHVVGGAGPEGGAAGTGSFRPEAKMLWRIQVREKIQNGGCPGPRARLSTRPSGWPFGLSSLLLRSSVW